MKCAIICCLLLCLCSESQTLDITLYRCISPDSKVVMFSCLMRSQLGADQWNCDSNYNSSAEQQNYKCNSEYRNFTLNGRILKNRLQPEKLDVAYLGIKKFMEFESFHSDTIIIFNGEFNQLNNIPSSISMPNLKEMNLSHNNFSSFTPGNFD